MNYMSMVFNEESIGNFPLDLDKKLVQFFNDKKLVWKLVDSPFKTKTLLILDTTKINGMLQRL